MQRFLLIMLIAALSGSAAVCQLKPYLKVSSDGHDLVYSDNKPFFWLGDTGWDLFFRLSTAEATRYLDNRKAKGFTVIQATLLPMFNLSLTDRNGQHPLSRQSPFEPNEKYFAHVDTVMRLAEQRHLIMALVACWIDDRPILDSAGAYRFGTWIGDRYNKFSNITWIIGGDRAPYNTNTTDLPFWRGLAHGIKAAGNPHQLLTYHPPGERSSTEWLHHEDWLDYNMMQSSHGRKNMPSWNLVRADRAMLPAKPTLDGEPNYEDHPVSPWPTWDSRNGYFRAYDVRKQLYRSVFAGACGVTYGHHAIWQFANQRDEIILYAERGWENALDRPGAYQAGYLRRLIESRPFAGRIPDTGLVHHTSAVADSAHREAFIGSDSSYCMVYLPVPEPVTINLSVLRAQALRGWWFNPRDASYIRVDIDHAGTEQTFAPPTRGAQDDWVLVIDNAARHFPPPGSTVNAKKQ